MNRRSTRQQLNRICRKVSGKSRVAKLTRVGTPQLTPLQVRMQDAANFRELDAPVHHLTYHICPFKNATSAWTWNLIQLMKRWSLFNGRKVLGVNYDSDTLSPADVINYCQSIGIDWDEVVVRKNDRRFGEILTWVPTLESLNIESCRSNDLVFSAHAKGVKYNGDSPPVIRDWTDVMYRANLDHIDRVHESLRWFSSTGCFRCRNNISEQSRYGWHYSGAFWWWRPLDISQRNWRKVGQSYAGREFWIGNQLERAEADCLFMDRSRSPYNVEYWKNIITPRWEMFQRERHAR